MEPLADPLTLAEITLRFVIASIAGGILGVPSQIRRHTAGIRTHALVSMGAVLFCISGIAIVGKESHELLRVIQGITSGVGFIGGAAVLRGTRSIQGINTAASVWIAAAVGCAVGFVSTPAVGIIGALIACAINLGLMVLESRVFHPGFDEDPPAGTDAPA